MLYSNNMVSAVMYGTIAFLVLVLLFQVIYSVGRPEDKNRLRYFRLLCLLMLYNISGTLFPDTALPLPVWSQNVLTHFSATALTICFVYYVYTMLRLTHLRPVVSYGSWLFILCPSILFFAIPYYVTDDLALCRKTFVILPAFYFAVFVYSVFRVLVDRYIRGRNPKRRTRSVAEAASLFVVLWCLVSLPVIGYLGDYRLLELFVVNAGFFLLIGVNAISSVRQYRAEYHKDQDTQLRLQQAETRVQLLEQQLKNMEQEKVDELEALNIRREDAFITLAHDSKTLLTLISNYLNQYIARVGSSQELTIIKSNIKNLIVHVTDFFDMERFNKGINVYAHDNVINAPALLKARLILFKALAAQKNISIEEAITENIWLKVHPAALERIFNNLLENSIRYTNTGGNILVVLSQQGDKVSFTVSDTGIGIPAGFHEQVFKPYIKVDRQMQTDGMGVGLAIVKQIVETLNGRIILNSEVNAGTEMTVILDAYNGQVTEDAGVDYLVEAGDLPMITSTSDAVDQVSDPGKPTILVVEDNMQLLTWLAHRLKETYNVYVAQNGMEALQKLKCIRKLHLVISDVMMPYMDGFAFYESLAGLKIYDHVPFIFLTAKNTWQDRQFGLKLGAIDYIDKPFLFELLLQKTESIINTFRKQETVWIRSVESAIKNMENSASSNNNDEILHETTLHEAMNFFEINCRKYGLTGRQTEICRLIWEGDQHKHIAQKLKIAEGTVAKHITTIFRKVKVSNKVELVKKLHEGMLEDYKS